jgi:hypothetical protein
VLCSCALAPSKIKENLKESGYTIKEFSAEEIASLNNDLQYKFGGNGSIVSAFYGVNENADDPQEDSVTVLEFSDKDDLTIMYKQIRLMFQEENKQNYKLDLSGNVLVYGFEKGVDAALD